MPKARLEAFSDGVIAIIITIMVLELRSPDGARWGSLQPLVPKFLTYALSFVFLGIYWSNHHHLVQTIARVNGRILWANLHLLFWLSLTPFVTAWMGESHFADAPTAFYGTVLLLAALAYYVLQLSILAAHPADSPLKRALGRDLKGKVSPVLYAVAIPLAYVDRWLALGVYIFVAALWLVPDKRIEALYVDARNA